MRDRQSAVGACGCLLRARDAAASTASSCFRKKPPPDTSSESVAQRRLLRCLSVVDLTAIGVGSTLGAGVYIVVGQVAKTTAGPAVSLSFLVAGVVSLLAGLCYAEFGARTPGAGSSYLYTFVSAGELPAFATGWNMILTYMITAASVAGTLSSYLDSLAGGSVFAWQRQQLALAPRSQVLRQFADALAGGLTLVMTLLLSGSVRRVARVNSVFTIVNLVVIAYVVACGAFRARAQNWSLDPQEAPPDASAGDGGFAPFGWAAVVQGAGTCFFAFVGFDTIATAGEEARRPQRDIPLSTVLCLCVCCAAYTAVAVVLTLVRPFYSLSDSAPLMAAFFDIGWPTVAYVVAVGALCSLCASMFGCIYPMPRVIYAMAQDGLLFRWLGATTAGWQSPAVATAVSGCAAAALATFVQIRALVDLASVGTLASYTAVALAVVYQRYSPQHQAPDCELLLLCCAALVGLLLLVRRPTLLAVACPLLALLALLLLLVLALLPQSRQQLAYRVPAVPLLPVASVACNLVLLFGFESHTWLLFGSWTGAGLLLYATWGHRHSHVAAAAGYERLPA